MLYADGNEAKVGDKVAIDEKYRGVVVPMITPFTPAGSVDAPAIAQIVEHLVSNAVHGIFPLGTTGESASCTQRASATIRARMTR